MIPSMYTCKLCLMMLLLFVISTKYKYCNNVTESYYEYDIGDIMEDIYKDNAGGKCISHNDYDKDMTSFKEKFIESFNDKVRINEDMAELRKKFGRLLAMMLKASNDTSDVYMMGMTPFHTNLRVFRVYMSNVFYDNTFTDMNIQDFIEHYFTSIVPNDRELDIVKSTDPEVMISAYRKRDLFRNLVLNNPTFGLKKVKADFEEFFESYVEIRMGINSALASGQSTDNSELDYLKDEVNDLFDNGVFSEWDNSSNSYVNMNNTRNNLKTQIFERIFDRLEGENDDFIQTCEYPETHIAPLLVTEETTDDIKQKIPVENNYRDMYDDMVRRRDISYNALFGI
ncbi:hypothetical protein QKU58_gp047 [Pyramimonas orientalis virus]|uniref:Uncharacterized protein n=1 Tax=Pyramimonas orientalis virus 01B TaxID=3134525 RepID=A0A7M3UNL7_9VIRU|nr:hypothetical protein QKU58_gp047 [Pyramimonas orientalis virus]QOI90284.1 hypothetical protein HWQ62_00147 [Pyramimonas orientalis virus]